MRNIVIRGIVETMNDQQLEARSRSLHSALDRLAAAREMRRGTVPVVDLRNGADDESSRPARRRGLFSFADRARGAVGDEPA